MARDTLTVQVIPSGGGALEDVAFTAFVVANLAEFKNDGKTMLLVKNGGTSGAQDVTVTTPVDEFGRERPATDVITTGQDDVSIAGPFDPSAFNTAGMAYVDGADEDVLSLAAVKFTPVN